MSHYLLYVIETFRNPGERSSNPVRARPFPGQGLPVDLRVSCSTRMRQLQPVNSFLLVQAKVVEHETGTQFLYAHPNSDYKKISREEAQVHIAATFSKFK